MGPLPTYRVGMNNFWRKLGVTSSGSSDLLVPPASTMATGGTWRPVITEVCIVGYNTNAAASVILLRNKDTPAEVFAAASMAPTTGSVSMSRNSWIPVTENVSLQLNVSALTGRVDVFIAGVFLPTTTPCADKYTGAP